MDGDLAVVDDVIHVQLVQVMSFQCVINQVRPFHVSGRVEAFHAGEMLGRPDPFVGQVCGVLFLVDLEIDAFFVENRSVVDIIQFVGLDRIHDNGVGNLRLL